MTSTKLKLRLTTLQNRKSVLARELAAVDAELTTFHSAELAEKLEEALAERQELQETVRRLFEALQGRLRASTVVHPDSRVSEELLVTLEQRYGPGCPTKDTPRPTTEEGKELLDLRADIMRMVAAYRRLQDRAHWVRRWTDEAKELQENDEEYTLSTADVGHIEKLLTEIPEC